MRKQFAYIAIVAMASMLFSGCYTVIATTRLTRKNWRKKHRYQYFSKTKWGKIWNTYYWAPSSKDFLGRSVYKTHKKNTEEKTEKKQTYEEPRPKHYYGPAQHYSSDDYSHDYSGTCASDCIEDCTSSCLSDLFDSIFGSDNKNKSDNDTIPPPDKRPRRRRGM